MELDDFWKGKFEGRSEIFTLCQGDSHTSHAYSWLPVIFGSFWCNQGSLYGTHVGRLCCKSVQGEVLERKGANSFE